MRTCYAVWDVDSGNLVGTFNTLAEAFDVVKRLVAANDVSYLDCLEIHEQPFIIVENNVIPENHSGIRF